MGTRHLEDPNKLPVPTRYFKHCRFACRFSGPEIDERFPEICSSDGETDETRDAGCRRQPFANLLFVLTATKNDAADLFAATTGTDSDWVVKVIDVFPDEVPNQPEMGGYQLPVSMDIFRGRYLESFERVWDGATRYEGPQR